ncbi:MAG: redoxin domain-containing protein [Candidatus Omnitrophica bacterium]|nr:redoxin domain-containing protein [Candidatus Omnitrophota bacterium]
MRARGSIFRIVTMVAVIMALFTSCSVGQSGKTAPDFTLTDLEGNIFNFSSTRGKVVILDFWATWCPPCRMEIPHFQELYEEYADSGLEIVGVALDKGGASVVRPFAQKMGVSYPVVPGGSEVASLYGGVRAIPTTFIINREGAIVSKAVGYRDKDFFEKFIKDLL